MFNCHQKTLCLAVLAVFCGCGQTQPVDAPDDTKFQAEPTVGEEQSTLTDDPSAESLAETDSTAPDQESDEQRTVAVYEPPYPDRVDLFLAPKREGRSTRNDQENAVELLGFVNVDLQRAVLMINGAVCPIAEGDSQFGVEVISIQPPAVVLQRGRQRWQATLEN